MNAAMTTAGRDSLNGRIVLVKSSKDRRDPPTALRGTIRVDHESRRVWVEVALPDMFTAPAHRREFELNDAQVEELLSHEQLGTYSCTVDYDFEKDARDQAPVTTETTDKQ
ncbi:MAG: hypothetical protein NVV63_14005 [Opitutus sp.]|nr:hypothetical protein [Opitutus sp.]